MKPILSRLFWIGLYTVMVLVTVVVAASGVIVLCTVAARRYSLAWLDGQASAAIGIAVGSVPAYALLDLVLKRLGYPLRRFQPPAGRCQACGYDLRATPGRCPECGSEPRRVRASSS